MDQTAKPFYDQPSIVEQLGHRRIYAWVQDVALADERVLLLIIPLPDGRETRQRVTLGSIFAITATTSEHLDTPKVRIYNENLLAGLDLLSPEDRARYIARAEAERERARQEFEKAHPGYPNPYEAQAEDEPEF